MAFIAHFDAAGNPNFVCSGTVVSSNVVLTAGHCAVDESTGRVLSPGSYRVVTGAADWTDTASRHVSGVSQVIVDPSYNIAAKTSDAALLILSTPTTAPAVRLATSADQDLAQPGTVAVIAGWGATYAGGLFQYLLQWAATVVQGPAYCGQFQFANFTYNPLLHLCAVDYPYDDTAACNGDSGGPMLTGDASGNAVEIGVTSVGPTDCNTVTADYFTAVVQLSSWVNGWISAVAPPSPTTASPPPPAAPAQPAPSPPRPTPPPSTPPASPQLPWLTFAFARTYVRETVAGAAPGAFRHQHQYAASCSRKSAIRISCAMSFESGPNDYGGTVTVYYLFGQSDQVRWSDNYALRWVNDQCYWHSKHRARCQIHRKGGSW
jgi:hypothetical protein